MREVLTVEDMAVLLGSAGLFVLGVLALTGRLTGGTVLVALLTAAGLLAAFYAGIEYGHPRRA